MPAKKSPRPACSCPVVNCANNHSPQRPKSPPKLDEQKVRRSLIDDVFLQTRDKGQEIALLPLRHFEFVERLNQVLC
jgi:hypothetical protein